MRRILERPRRAVRALALTAALCTVLTAQASPAPAAVDPNESIKTVRSLPLPTVTVHQIPTLSTIRPEGSLYYPGDAVISGDGNWVGYSTARISTDGATSYAVNRATGETKQFYGVIIGFDQNGSKAVYRSACVYKYADCGVYTLDLTTGARAKVSVDGNGRSEFGTMSNEGASYDGANTIVFGTTAKLVPGLGDAGPSYYAYYRDLQSGFTQVLRDPQSPSTAYVRSATGISPGGQYIAYWWSDQDKMYLSVLDQVTGRHTRITSVPGATSAYSPPSVSTGGKLVFTTRERLVPQDTNDVADVYLRDLVSGDTTLVSADASGTATGTAGEGSARITADGRYVIYRSPGNTVLFREVATGRQRELTDPHGAPLKYRAAEKGDIDRPASYSPIGLSRTGRYLAMVGFTDIGFEGLLRRDQAQDCAGDFATIRGSGTIYGSPGDDVIYGSEGPDTIYGYGGDDVICGLGGDDVIDGGPGDDAIYGGEGNDRIEGNEGNDVVDGGPGADSMNGGPGTDAILYLSAKTGVDVSLNHVTPNGAPGEGDQVYNDFEVIFGSKYNDTLSGRETSDWLFGMGGDDLLLGGDGDDHLYGGDGKDVLVGMAGDDDLNGGPSWADACNGGPGNNTYFNCQGITGRP
ncbi:hypothetical protein [Sphaerisporangium sp. NPDC051011]|uniref:hypothetical protein n=1 Tax=Sphaerisporangium sp. NPDC051011 TaxID=3155792 RepID=UPI0033C71574